MAVCSEIHTEHINILCGQNVEFVSAKPGGGFWVSVVRYYSDGLVIDSRWCHWGFFP